VKSRGIQSIEVSLIPQTSIRSCRVREAPALQWRPAASDPAALNHAASSFGDLIGAPSIGQYVNQATKEIRSDRRP
jgi:hypothetical protein